MTHPFDARLPESFWSKVEVNDVTGCWKWLGYKIVNGYGQFWLAGKMQTAHRVSYEQLVGPIGSNKQLDHLCHSTATDCAGGMGCIHRACVNPDHLEPVTAAENMNRGVQAFQGRTHCLSGRHLITPENTIIKVDGRRRCRACKREAGRRGDRRRRAKVTPQVLSGAK